jgi:hypothetical protein
MRFFAVLVLLGSAMAFGAFACGGNDKPPLTPDAENAAGDASAPTPPTN